MPVRCKWKCWLPTICSFALFDQWGSLSVPQSWPDLISDGVRCSLRGEDLIYDGSQTVANSSRTLSAKLGLVDWSFVCPRNHVQSLQSCSIRLQLESAWNWTSPRIVYQPSANVQAVQFDTSGLKVGDLYELCSCLNVVMLQLRLPEIQSRVQTRKTICNKWPSNPSIKLNQWSTSDQPESEF